MSGECDKCGDHALECKCFGYMKWIKVEDRLPEDDRRVLGTDGKKHEIVCCINSDCEWVGATSDYGYLMSLSKVTHWMPLPKLPE